MNYGECAYPKCDADGILKLQGKPVCPRHVEVAFRAVFKPPKVQMLLLVRREEDESLEV